MKNLAFMLAVAALVAVPAVAASPWTTYEYSYSYHTNYYWYNGQYYSGTYSYEYSYQWKDNGKNYLTKGSSSGSFEADDGSLSASWSNTWNDKFSYDSARTYSSNGHRKFFDSDGKLIEVVNTTYHYTFNANGELTSYHYN